MKQGKNITEMIIEALEAGPKEKARLIKETCLSSGTTVQGVYKVLRELKQNEVITIHNGVVGFSIVWIEQQILKYSKIAQTYQIPTRESYFLQLKSGESIVFKFRTLRELELFWTHSFVLLGTQTAKETPMFAVVPHDWFSIARPGSDEIWTKRLGDGNRPQGVVITHPTELDKMTVFARKAKSSSLEYVFGENPYRQNERRYARN